MDPMKLLIVIAPKSKGTTITNYLNKQQVSLRFSCLGSGTVESRLKFYLGITDTSKSVIFAPIKAKEVNKILLGIDKLVKLEKEGAGIAFTIPMTSIISNLSLDYLQGNTKRRKINNAK